MLRPRLPVYPEFMSDRWIDPGLLPKLIATADEQGYAQLPQMDQEPTR